MCQTPNNVVAATREATARFTQTGDITIRHTFDNAENRDWARENMEREGYECTSVDSGDYSILLVHVYLNS